MPGRTPHDAVAVFLEPIREAISCLGRAKLTVSPGGRGTLGQTHLLTVNAGEPMALPGGLTLDLNLHYEIVRISRAGVQPFRVTTRAYLHTIAKPGASEIISAHWHPTGNSGRTEPHWHVGAAALVEDGVFSPRAHIPSPRVSCEAMVRLAIEQLDVRPVRQDWDAVLESGERDFAAHRSWD